MDHPLRSQALVIGPWRGDPAAELQGAEAVVHGSGVVLLRARRMSQIPTIRLISHPFEHATVIIVTSLTGMVLVFPITEVHPMSPEYVDPSAQSKRRRPA